MNKLFDVEDNLKNKKYTNLIPKIQYKPKCRNSPSIFSLYNLEKYNLLIKEIENSNLDNEIKKFLKLSATRHIVFDYEKIAEYYCHADKLVQELMEKSGLVIIDFEDAMENGFVEMQKNLRDIYENNKK